MSFRLSKWSVRWHIYRLARCCNIYVLFDVALKVAHKSLIITVIIMPFTFFVVVFTSLFTSYGSSNRFIDVSFTNGGSWIDSRCGFLPGRYPIFYHWFLSYYIHLYLYYFSMPFIHPTTKKTAGKVKCAERFHRKRSWKWIKTKTHRYRISADGRKRIKMKTMTSYVPRAS